MDRAKLRGDVTLLGQQDYSMRVWLDPDRLAYNKLTAPDVVNAVREQNVQVAAGQVGQEPVPAGQAYQIEHASHGLTLLLQRHAAESQWEGNVGEDALVRKEGVALEDGVDRPPIRWQPVDPPVPRLSANTTA